MDIRPRMPPAVAAFITNSARATGGHQTRYLLGENPVKRHGENPMKRHDLILASLFAGDNSLPPAQKTETDAPNCPGCHHRQRAVALRACCESARQMISRPISYCAAGQEHGIASHRNPSWYRRTSAGEPTIANASSDAIVKVPERVSECVNRLADQLFTGSAAALDFGALIHFVKQG